MRRVIPALTTIAAVGAIVALSLGTPSEDTAIPRARGLEPLRMPFTTGTVAFCQQGTGSEPPRSHSTPSLTDAIDLVVGGAGETPIVAVADGIVVESLMGVGIGEISPGYGLGNVVVVAHGDGYFARYAHLDDVLAGVGDSVTVGQQLGTIGNTGRAGNVHLHFSLHHAEAWDWDAPTTPFWMMTADVTEAATVTFAPLASWSFECGGANVAGPGHYYASETAATGVVRGTPSDALREAVLRDRATRPIEMEANNTVAIAMKRFSGEGPAATRAKLLRVPVGRDDYLLAQYWVAVLSLRDLDDWAEARRAAAVLAASDTATPDWLGPWALVRRAQVAEHDGDAALAKRLWTMARESGYRDDEFDVFIARAPKT
jgi:hypothetical protein